MFFSILPAWQIKSEYCWLVYAPIVLWLVSSHFRDLFIWLSELFEMQVTVSKDDTVILDGAGDKKAIEERAEQVDSIIWSFQDNLDIFNGLF